MKNLLLFLGHWFLWSLALLYISDKPVYAVLMATILPGFCLLLAVFFVLLKRWLRKLRGPFDRMLLFPHFLVSLFFSGFSAMVMLFSVVHDNHLSRDCERHNKTVLEHLPAQTGVDKEIVLSSFHFLEKELRNSDLCIDVMQVDPVDTIIAGQRFTQKIVYRIDGYQNFFFGCLCSEDGCIELPDAMISDKDLELLRSVLHE